MCPGALAAGTAWTGPAAYSVAAGFGRWTGRGRRLSRTPPAETPGTLSPRRLPWSPNPTPPPQARDESGSDASPCPDTTGTLGPSLLDDPTGTPGASGRLPRARDGSGPGPPKTIRQGLRRHFPYPFGPPPSFRHRAAAEVFPAPGPRALPARPSPDVAAPRVCFRRSPQLPSEP